MRRYGRCRRWGIFNTKISAFVETTADRLRHEEKTLDTDSHRLTRIDSDSMMLRKEKLMNNTLQTKERTEGIVCQVK